MKKTYQAPCVEVNKISVQQTLLITSPISIGSDYDGESNIESRGRGDYEPAEDSDNFGDLW